MSFKGIFQAVAPFLSTTVQMAAPGPLGAMAAGIISKAAGKDVKPADVPDVMAQMAQTQDGLLKLKQADQDFQARMTEMGFDTLEKLQAVDEQDRASARTRESDLAKAGAKDYTPKVLAYLMAALAITVSVLMLSGRATVMKDPTQAAMAGAVLGYVFNELKQVYSYYFGSSSGSDRKTELLAQVPGIKTE